MQLTSAEKPKTAYNKSKKKKRKHNISQSDAPL